MIKHYQKVQRLLRSDIELTRQILSDLLKSLTQLKAEPVLFSALQADIQQLWSIDPQFKPLLLDF